jgi:hypothetical protein
MRFRRLALLMVLTIPGTVHSQTRPPAAEDLRVRALVPMVSADRIERDIRQLAAFGTRHTLSDTVSMTRGIGAARRWLKAEFDRIGRDCGGCLEVFFDEGLIVGEEGTRVPVDVGLVNVVAIQRGHTHPERYVLITGHYDSRVSDPMDATSDAPGANDDASGTAATLEAARILSRHRFGKTLVYAALAGEEQGLHGGRQLAERAQREGWIVEAVLNNDIIGNIEGLDGLIENTRFRVFSEPTPANETDEQRRRRRFRGGEVDGISRQVARYVDRITDRYVPGIDAVMIYRLDRFGRGGDHRRFNDLGFPAVRLTEMHENYTRQHQDLRIEDGIAYGDVPEGVDARYAARIVAVNVAAMASLAWAPPPPDSVTIGGAVRPSTTLRWSRSGLPDGGGYRVFWRETTAPQWQFERWVGDTTAVILENIVIDNYLFGVAAVGPMGNESVVVFPGAQP